MAEQSLIFPADEYRQRVTRLQADMAIAGLDSLLLTTPPDIFYVTGFLTRFWESPARAWFLVVPREGDPIAVIPSIGADLMGRSWITDIRTWDAPNPHDSGMGLLADALKSVVSDGGSIGVPMGLETHLRMPLGDYTILKDALGARKLVDATDCVQQVREIKSEAEIGKLRQICEVAARAFEKVPEFAKAGTGLDTVFRAFQVACLQEGADWVSYVAGAAGQGGYGDVISPATPTPLQAGDILMLDTGAVGDGYFCDFDRNFAIGAPDDASKRTHSALWHVTEDVLRKIRPGHRASDVHQMLTEGLLQKDAAPCGGRFGHGLGLSLTEWPSLSAFDDTPLRAGMVLTLEPSAFVSPGRMMVHEENFVLRESGAELLSPRAPETLPVIEI